MIVHIHVQIHNYKFRNYNEMEEAFVQEDEGDGSGDDGERCVAFRIIAVMEMATFFGFTLQIPSGG